MATGDSDHLKIQALVNLIVVDLRGYFPITLEVRIPGTKCIQGGEIATCENPNGSLAGDLAGAQRRFR